MFIYAYTGLNKRELSDQDAGKVITKHRNGTNRSTRQAKLIEAALSQWKMTEEKSDPSEGSDSAAIEPGAHTDFHVTCHIRLMLFHIGDPYKTIDNLANNYERKGKKHRCISPPDIGRD